MKKIFAVVLILLITVGVGSAQKNRFRVTGTITSAESGELMLGVTVQSLNMDAVVGVTDVRGIYSASLSAGEQTLVFKILGSEPDTVRLNIKQDMLYDVVLQVNSRELEGVVVSSSHTRERVHAAQVGVEHLSTLEMNKLPVLFGERDILKTMQLLPGVGAASEGSSGFTVRGGGLDQNLILLDEAPVYNASHLMGFFSTFNSAAIKDATIYKGNFPARYGGRLASVVDVTMKNGDNRRFRTEGGIGIISSNLTVEAPIQRGRSSFLLSGRRTYADMFLLFSKDEDMRSTRLYFYDLNAKASFEINNKNRIYVSGYLGRDVLGMKKFASIDWGNGLGSVRWNSIISPRLLSNMVVVMSDYNYNIGGTFMENSFSISSRIRDMNVKEELTFNLGTGQNLKVGYNAIMRTVAPITYNYEGSMSIGGGDVARSTMENALYASYDTKLYDRLTVEAGVRTTLFTMIGGRYNTWDGDILVGTHNLGKRKMGKSYPTLEPRIVASFLINNTSSVKLAYGRNSQNLHMLSNSTVSSPTDQWLGSSYTMKPTLGNQFSAGYFNNFADEQFEFSIEGYYKNSKNEVDFKNGAVIFNGGSDHDIESQFVFGVGRSYGAEVMLRKRHGQLTGWVAYTLSRSERQIDDVNDGNWYPIRQDRTHDVSVVAMYDISKRWQVSATWVFRTGDAVTYPSGKYLVTDNTGSGGSYWVPLYTERNGHRMANYHRLDLGATFNCRPKGASKRWQGSWTFGLYNAYGRENPYMIFFEADTYTDPQSGDTSGKIKATQISLFRWVPSVSYNFKF